MADEDGFDSSPKFAPAPLQAVESQQQQHQQPPQAEQQQQADDGGAADSPTNNNNNYAMRRLASGNALRQEGSGGSPTGSPKKERVPIKIPQALQFDMRRLVFGGSSSTNSSPMGSPTTSSSAAASSGASNKPSARDIIGSGAFGTVCRGELLPDPRAGGDAQQQQQQPVPVAVKILDRAKCENSAFMNMQVELDVSAELRHPCLVNTLGVGIMSADDSPLHAESICIIMELAARGELLKYMKRYGLEDMQEVGPKFVAEAVLGLEFLASKKLIHRDLKPENLLLTQECHVKMSDFGTICELGGPDAAVFRGTTAYAAPEVLTPGGSVTITTDLWALGCVVFELYVGQPPFTAESDYLLRQVIRSREFEFPPYFPAVARDLVSQLLDLDPDKRLGAAPRGGFAVLKQHPFFAHVCWETLLQQSHVTTLNADFQAEVGPLLLDKEEIVFAGHIKKERFLSVKQRLLVLTNFPRLFYIEPGTFTIKGQVPWSDNICAEVESPSVFRVHTGDGNRVYHFVDDAGQRASTWTAKINMMVKEQKVKARLAGRK